MPGHRYSYRMIEQGGVYRPLVPVRFLNPDTGTSYTWDGLLDTGASVTIIPAAIAEATGHDLKGPGVQDSVTTGIERSKITTYLHTFTLALMHPTDVDRIVWQGPQRRFDCTEQTMFFPLLGSRDFLCYFKIVFDYGAAKTTFYWVD